MRDILIINLRQVSEIYQSAHLAHSLFKSDPQSRIYYLVFEEFAPIVECLNGIYKIFTISKKKITTFYKNEIYSSGFGIDELEKNLRPMIEIPRRNVINFSNDETSKHITSYITETTRATFSGVRFSAGANVEYSGPWANVYDNIMPSYFPSPVSITDIVHLQSGLGHFSEGEKIKTNSQHNITVSRHFEKLRKINRDKTGFPGKVVGFQLKASQESKNIPFRVIVQLLRLYVQEEGLAPICLLAPTEEERDLIDRVNKALSKKIVSVETDMIALPSVVQHLDLVVTPDAYIKHVCDLLDTPCLEISLGPSLTFQQGTCNPKSKILTFRIDKRSLSQHSSLKKSIEREGLESNDLFECTKAMLGNKRTDFLLREKKQWTLYSPTRDILGTFLTNESGFINLDIELRYLLARQTLSKIFKDSFSVEIFTYIMDTFEENELKKWIEKEKNHLALTSKNLLVTIKMLIQTQEDRQKGQRFVFSLEKLLDRSQEKHLSALPVLLFRGLLEAIAFESIEENIKEVENLLYKLKDYMQTTTLCLKELEAKILEKKRDDLVGRIKYTNYEIET